MEYGRCPDVTANGVFDWIAPPTTMKLYQALAQWGWDQAHAAMAQRSTGTCPEPPDEVIFTDCYKTAERAAQWGWDQAMAQRSHAGPQAAADMELEACCEFLDAELPKYGGFMRLVPALRAARRPPALNAREQALALLDAKWAGTTVDGARILSREDAALLRRALEGGDG